MTEWRPVASLGGAYEASSDGRVRSARTRTNTFVGRILVAHENRHGYLTITPQVNCRARTRPVHALVAEAFIGPRPTGAVINHIDGCKTNNTPANLEYVTPGANTRHASRLGLLAAGDQHYARREPERLAAVRRTHCPQGHAIDGRRRSGHRFCRTCKRVAGRKSYAIHAEERRRKARQRYACDPQYRARCIARSRASKQMTVPAVAG